MKLKNEMAVRTGEILDSRTIVLGLWVIVLPFMQLSLTRVGKTDVTLGSVIALILFSYLIFAVRYQIRHIVLALVFVTAITATGLFAGNPKEFFASYIQIFGFIGALLIAFHLTSTANAPSSVRLFLGVASLVATLIIIQFLAWNLLSLEILRSPLGPFAPLGPGSEVYVPNPESTIKRPQGLFSEPSVAAWFMSLAYAVALSSKMLSGRSALLSSLLCGIAALATMTLSGVLNVLLISLGSLWVRKGYFGHLVSILILGVIFGAIAGGDAIVDFFATRFLEFFVEGTSSYYRIVAPTLLLIDSLPLYPFGHLLGDTAFIESKSYMINWEHGSTTNIDNSFFLVSYYFGIPGVILSGAVVTAVFVALLRKRHWALIGLALVLALSETGALWSPHIALFVAYAVLLIRSAVRLDSRGSTAGHRVPSPAY